jgi:hypothetical protein
MLSWRNPQNGRRYQAVLTVDLFGDSVLWRGWCGADGKRGGERKDVFTWESDGLSALRRVSRRRERRGYVLLDELLPCSERRVGGGLLPRGHIQREAAAAQEAPEKDAGMERALKPLVQIAPGDALGERA